MEKYNSKTLKLKKFEKSEMKTIQITAKDENDNFSIQDIKNILTGLEKKYPNGKFRIRGMADYWKTLKSMDSELMTDGEIDEYLNNRVKNTGKFKSFNQMEFTVVSMK